MAAVKRARRGPRPRMTREEVVAKAVELVDRSGAEALTIRRLADACGLSPMGIYRYVRSRDELLDLVVEHVLEELPHGAAEGGWKLRAAALFRGFRRMALAHPGVSLLGVARVSPVPAMARFTDRALAILDDGGFEGDAVVLAYDALLMFTVGSVIWQIPRSGAERKRLLEAVAGDDPPPVHLLRHAPTLGARDPDRYFEHGLALLLDGLESRRTASDQPLSGPSTRG